MTEEVVAAPPPPPPPEAPKDAGPKTTSPGYDVGPTSITSGLTSGGGKGIDLSKLGGGTGGGQTGTETKEVKAEVKVDPMAKAITAAKEEPKPSIPRGDVYLDGTLVVSATPSKSVKGIYENIGLGELPTGEKVVVPRAGYVKYSTKKDEFGKIKETIEEPKFVESKWDNDLRRWVYTSTGGTITQRETIPGVASTGWIWQTKEGAIKQKIGTDESMINIGYFGPEAVARPIISDVKLTAPVENLITTTGAYTGTGSPIDVPATYILFKGVPEQVTLSILGSGLNYVAEPILKLQDGTIIKYSDMTISQREWFNENFGTQIDAWKQSLQDQVSGSIVTLKKTADTITYNIKLPRLRGYYTEGMSMLDQAMAAQERREDVALRAAAERSLTTPTTPTPLEIPMVSTTQVGIERMREGKTTALEPWLAAGATVGAHAMERGEEKPAEKTIGQGVLETLHWENPEWKYDTGPLNIGGLSIGYVTMSALTSTLVDVPYTTFHYLAGISPIGALPTLAGIAGKAMRGEDATPSFGELVEISPLRSITYTLGHPGEALTAGTFALAVIPGFQAVAAGRPFLSAFLPTATKGAGELITTYAMPQAAKTFLIGGTATMGIGEGLRVASGKPLFSEPELLGTEFAAGGYSAVAYGALQLGAGSVLKDVPIIGASTKRIATGALAGAGAGLSFYGTSIEIAPTPEEGIRTPFSYEEAGKMALIGGLLGGAVEGTTVAYEKGYIPKISMGKQSYTEIRPTEIDLGGQGTFKSTTLVDQPRTYTGVGIEWFGKTKPIVGMLDESLTFGRPVFEYPTIPKGPVSKFQTSLAVPEYESYFGKVKELTPQQQQQLYESGVATLVKNPEAYPYALGDDITSTLQRGETRFKSGLELLEYTSKAPEPSAARETLEEVVGGSSLFKKKGAVKEIVKILEEESADVVIGGSTSQRRWMGELMGRPIKDIDLNVVHTDPAGLAQKIVQRLKPIYGDDIRLDPELSSRVQIKLDKTGEFVHGVEIHKLGEAPPPVVSGEVSDVMPSEAGALYYGYTGKEPITLGGIKTQALSEQGIRKWGPTLTPSKLGPLGKPHRIVSGGYPKDPMDALVITGFDIQRLGAPASVKQAYGEYVSTLPLDWQSQLKGLGFIETGVAPEVSAIGKGTAETQMYYLRLRPSKISAGEVSPPSPSLISKTKISEGYTSEGYTPYEYDLPSMEPMTRITPSESYETSIASLAAAPIPSVQRPSKAAPSKSPPSPPSVSISPPSISTPPYIPPSTPTTPPSPPPTYYTPSSPTAPSISPPSVSPPSVSPPYAPVSPPSFMISPPSPPPAMPALPEGWGGGRIKKRPESMGPAEEKKKKFPKMMFGVPRIGERTVLPDLLSVMQSQLTYGIEKATVISPTKYPGVWEFERNLMGYVPTLEQYRQEPVPEEKKGPLFGGSEKPEWGSKLLIGGSHRRGGGVKLWNSKKKSGLL